MKNHDEPDEPQKPVLSEKDERLLKYVALIAGAMQQQAKPPSAQDRDKTFWTALREPMVVATLITVLIGGIAATLVTGIIQWRAGVREFEQGLQKSRSDQALVQYTKYLDQEQSLISRVYNLIGACTSAVDNVIGLTEKRWRDRRPDVSQVKGIIQNYNATKAKWDREELEVEQLMGYYHPTHPEAVTAWRKIPDIVKAYFKCADGWHEKYLPDLKHPKPPPTEEELDNACKQQYDALITHLNELTNILSVSQPHPGEGLGVP
jgi:hypothetical protein